VHGVEPACEVPPSLHRPTTTVVGRYLEEPSSEFEGLFAENVELYGAKSLEPDIKRRFLRRKIERLMSNLALRCRSRQAPSALVQQSRC